MTDEASEITYFRVQAVNGSWFNAEAPISLHDVWRHIKADGYFHAFNSVYVPYHAIAFVGALTKAQYEADTEKMKLMMAPPATETRQ